MFQKRVVTIELTEPMLGTVCKDPEVKTLQYSVMVARRVVYVISMML